MMMQVNPRTMANKTNAMAIKMSHGHDIRLDIIFSQYIHFLSSRIF